MNNIRSLLSICASPLLVWVSVALISSSIVVTTPALAQSLELEEIVVNARKREESLQDVPVVVQSLGKETIERLNLTNIRDFAEMVPSFFTIQRGAGTSASLVLRGIGTNNSEAFFDSSVAMNFDGVVANNSRLINQANLDTRQVDILKGPQSLYFGKGTTAGIIAIESANPTEEFEAHLKASYEFEEEGTVIEGVISGPLTNNLQARLATRVNKVDVVQENNVRDFNPQATVTNEDRGEESTSARLTLAWQPSENVDVNFKYGFSDYDNDGQFLFSDVLCVNNVRQATRFTLFPFGFPPVPAAGDCDYEDGRVQYVDQIDILAANFPGNNGGVPFTRVDLDLARLQVEWHINDSLKLTSSTSYLEMDAASFDNFSFSGSHGINGVSTFDTEESVSQEFRLDGQLSESFRYQVGAYYQEKDLFTRNLQDSFGVVLASAFIPGLNQIFVGGADPVTGFTSDYDRSNTIDTETTSIFGSITWDITDKLELNAGLRWTDEEKQAVYFTPFVHPAYPTVVGGLGIPSAPSGFVSAPINFEDDNVSPELTLTYDLSDETSVYLAYKTGFKSGGISSSLLPIGSAAVAIGAVPGLPANLDSFKFESEEVDGFELGYKAILMGGNLQLNAALYEYVYDNLQEQQFLGRTIQFTTFNAGEVTNRGADVSWQWSLSDQLLFRGNLAWLDNKYSAPFVTVNGADLNGSEVPRSPDLSGNIGLDYVFKLSDNLNAGISGTVHYSDGYFTDSDSINTVNELRQSSFTRTDLVAYISDSDGKWELALTAKNIGDKIYYADAGDVAPTLRDAAGRADRAVYINRGRQVFLEATYNF